MPRKTRQKNRDRETGYFFVIILFVIGVAILVSGNLIGILLIFLSLIYILTLFPSVGKYLNSMSASVQQKLEERRERRKVQVIREDSEKIVVQKNELLEEILGKIQSFRPYKRPSKEKQLEDMLMQHLRVYFPSLRTQLSYENTRIDGEIKRIGIELKYQPNEADLDRLFGQVEKYSRHLKHVIVVVAYERSRESVTHFRSRLKRRNLHGQVSVVSIP